MNTVKVSKNHWIVKFLTLKPHENLLFGKLQYLKHSWLDFDVGPCPYDTCSLRKLLIQHLFHAIFMILFWVILFSAAIVTVVSSSVIVPLSILFDILPANNWLNIWGLVFGISVIFTSFIVGIIYLSVKIPSKFRIFNNYLDKKSVISKLYLSLKEKFCYKIEYVYEENKNE